jgi:ferric-chelate reductase [NAD(P)H]
LSSTILSSKVFAVSVLDESAPMKFFGPFGFRSGRDIDKFEKTTYREGVTGCPMVTEDALSILGGCPRMAIFPNLDVRRKL